MTTNKAVLGVQDLLTEIETQSRRMSWPIIGPHKGRYLAETVRQYRVKKVIEVGTLVGYSAILIASNLPDNGEMDTIEINPRSAQIAEENVRRVNLSQKIRIHIGNALDVIPTIDETFDMAFIDAAKDEYMAYLELIEPKLIRGGVVFADNVKIFASQMRDYLDYVRISGKYESRYIDVGFDGVEVSVKLF